MDAEATYLKVPFECLKRSVKERSQHLADEVASISSAVASAATAGCDAAAADAILATQLSRLQALQSQLEHLGDSEQLQVQRVRARIETVAAAADAEAASVEAARWRALRVDRAVVDALLRCGYFESGTKLAAALGVTPLVDGDVFQEAQVVVAALRLQDCDPALAWCETHRPRLRRVKASLEFKLRAQQFVELVRARRPGDALAHARLHLAPQATAHLAEFTAVVATLAFGPETACPAYAPLFDAARWAGLADDFLKEAYRLHCLTADPLLHIYLQAGLIALRSPAGTPLPDSPEDPMSSPAFRALAAGLPTAKRGRSRLVCAITGRAMDDHDPPMVLPNGHIYSKSALEAMARQHGGRITCPQTGDVHALADLTKAYIL